MRRHTQSLKSLLVRGQPCFATCWRITRADGVILRFTEHDCALVVAGETFTPMGGFDASARQKQQGLRTRNLETRGVLSSDAITTEDLQAGKYQDAMLEEFLVDFKYPWAGLIQQAVWWTTDITFTEEGWSAQLEGLGSFLQRPIGRLINRTCDADLGDANCGVNLASYTLTAQTVAEVVDQRVEIKTSIPVGHGNGYYTLGVLTWTSGNNNGFTSEIKDYKETAGRLVLQLRTPYDIAVSDTFSIYPGCDRTASTCKNKFNNRINFRGFMTVPGTAEAMSVPDR